MSIVVSRISLDNGVLVIEGTKHAEDTANDGKFDARVYFSGFKLNQRDQVPSRW